jgi:hypothetical protein
MSKRALVVAALLVGLAAGCSGGEASPSPSSTPTTPTQAPTSRPAATPTTETGTEVPTDPPKQTGPASCVAEPLDFPVNENIPPLTAEDWVHGPADAQITFIEYADFQ